MGTYWGRGVKHKICSRIGPEGGGFKRFRLIVGSHLHFTKLIVLGWVGSAEMWELRIRCSNWGWMCKRQNMFKNWSGRYREGENRYL